MKTHMTALLTLARQRFFLRRLPASGGRLFYPMHISTSRALSNKIPTAVPIVSGSSFSMVPLPVSHIVDIRQKSKMAVAKMKYTDFYVCIADGR